MTSDFCKTPGCGHHVSDHYHDFSSSAQNSGGCSNQGCRCAEFRAYASSGSGQHGSEAGCYS